MANKKITDATTATSVAGTDKVFLNQGGDLKQVDLNSAVANSQAVQTLNSNLGLMYYQRISLSNGKYTFNGKSYSSGTVLVIGVHCGDNVNFEIGALIYPRVTPNLFYRISNRDVLPTDFTAIK